MGLTICDFKLKYTDVCLNKTHQKNQNGMIPFIKHKSGYTPTCMEGCMCTVHFKNYILKHTVSLKGSKLPKLSRLVYVVEVILFYIL